MQRLVSGLVILLAVLGVLTAIGAQIQLSAPPAPVEDSSATE